MKKLLFCALLTLILPAAASAKTFNLPSAGPVATVTLPDNWSPNETTTGVEATSDDSGVYVSIDVANAAKAEDALKQTMEFLVKQGVTVDEASMQRQEAEINGMKMLVMTLKAKDKEGVAEVSILLLLPSPDKFLIFTYWGSPEAAKKHGNTLNGILTSIKKAG